MDKLTALRSKQEILERKKAAMPSPEAVRPIIEELDALAADIRQATISLEAITQRYEECGAEIEVLAGEKERLLEHAANSEFAAKHNKRVIGAAQRIQSTLQEFRNRVVLRHLETLEGLITDACTSLFRKESFVKRVEILPSTYELKLFSDGNREIRKGRLSAGERQLIAVAVLWALARASGKPIPTVIDTPLGRLDGSHRQHLVSHYFPSASHQVLLLSTDTEIDKTYHPQLSPAVGREYVIEYDSKTRSSSVKIGYLW
jgi:DNA sulfur modification protein DndD